MDPAALKQIVADTLRTMMGATAAEPYVRAIEKAIAAAPTERHYSVNWVAPDHRKAGAAEGVLASDGIFIMAPSAERAIEIAMPGIRSWVRHERISGELIVEAAALTPLDEFGNWATDYDDPAHPATSEYFTVTPRFDLEARTFSSSVSSDGEPG